MEGLSFDERASGREPNNCRHVPGAVPILCNTFTMLATFSWIKHTPGLWLTLMAECFCRRPGCSLLRSP